MRPRDAHRGGWVFRVPRATHRSRSVDEARRVGLCMVRRIVVRVVVRCGGRLVVIPASAYQMSTDIIPFRRAGQVLPRSHVVDAADASP